MVVVTSTTVSGEFALTGLLELLLLLLLLDRAWPRTAWTSQA